MKILEKSNLVTNKMIEFPSFLILSSNSPIPSQDSIDNHVIKKKGMNNFSLEVIANLKLELKSINSPTIIQFLHKVMEIHGSRLTGGDHNQGLIEQVSNDSNLSKFDENLFLLLDKLDSL